MTDTKMRRGLFSERERKKRAEQYDFYLLKVNQYAYICGTLIKVYLIKSLGSSIVF